MSKEFNKIKEYDPKTLMIVDALNLAFRWKHSGQLEFLEDYLRTVESLRKSYSAGKVVIACDSGNSQYRKNLLPTYKQNRKDKFELQTEEEKVLFELFFEEFNVVMESFIDSTHYPVFRFEKTEADDIAAYIVKNKNKYNVDNIILVSSDKDWDLLIQNNVMRFSYVTRKEISLGNWNEHYDYNPDEHISIKCITGDSGDGIPGVSGIGPKRALSLIKEYGTAYDIAANIPIPSRYKYIDALNSFGSDNILLNYKLMDILEFCDEALGDNCKAIDKVLKDYLQ